MKKNTCFIIALMLSFIIFGNSIFAVYIPVKGDPSKYKDIEGHWAYNSINAMISLGYFKGVTDTEFKPDTDVSRAMLVTVLWRLTGDELYKYKTVDGITKKLPKYINMFWDMKDDAWYTDYISWANENDIISGYSKREFRPDEAMTREQIATVLYNYLKNYKLVRNFDGLKVKEAVEYTDAAQIADWAKDKISIVQQIGLMEGRNDGRFDPKANVTRAEIAVIIERLLKIV